MSFAPLGKLLADLPPRAKLALMVGSDALFLPLCAFAAVALRLGSPADALDYGLPAQVALGLLTLPVLGMAGLYRAVVRYIDIGVLAVAGVALAAAALVTYMVAYVTPANPIPRAAVLIYWFIAFSYVVSSRFIARALLRRGLGRAGPVSRRTAIYGAGAGGVQLALAMRFSHEYVPVCFIDDSPRLQHKTVAGLRVYAPGRIADAAYRHDVEQIVVAIPSLGSARRRELIRRIEHTGLPVRILRNVVDLEKGQATLADIREVDVADMLGRDPVPPDPSLFGRDIVDKVVLVTGAGGSIGSELCRQIASQKPKRIVLFDHSEYALYAIDQELLRTHAAIEVVARLGSVLDEPALLDLMRAQGVQTVYHAAAYKHVPLVEDNVRQGLRNNVFGSLAVVHAAQKAGVRTCVLVSTDKAVRPTNVMGASKRAAELIFQAAALRAGTQAAFSIVRFGNVLGSSGSVVPLFKQQIAAGGPITITHPEIIRYFMLIPEAAQLVIQAGAMARGGEVFVLDMGEPVRIADLARSLIHLSGLSEKTDDDPDGHIEIRYVGLRPGEKLYEELLIGDDVVPSGHPRIMSARERHIDPALLDKMLESLRAAVESNDGEAMLRQMRNLVPEYRSADEVNAEVATARQAR